ncbi:metal-sensing transcriptional repressor [Pseudalkalibacillus salsuginis]|uniref:metal-sensing transcriptional repressor n=1 Tax=Pseudalkalibacillus salsuginis TaxID=2910972 RepID=UPI001CD5D98E|nr:metal-sensing transcriptional repressor [Pseudalkalibacillus salsuginis]MCF6409316.1 metal-sensing transcriptional repressor [Pseudalkalibacillus salsuginis]
MEEHDSPIIPRTENEKIKIKNRLKRIEGQVRGLNKMVEEDRYCMDILVQISAINSALKQVGFSLMERHANTCVKHSIESGNGDEYIEELMKIVRQFSKS